MNLCQRLTEQQQNKTSGGAKLCILKYLTKGVPNTNAMVQLEYPPAPTKKKIKAKISQLGENICAVTDTVCRSIMRKSAGLLPNLGKK